MNLARVVAVKRSSVDGLMKLPNVVGVGVGYKSVGGMQTGELSIVVSVTAKLKNLLTSDEFVPVEIDGVRTDVIETGQIVARQETTDRWRPALGGVSVGHKDITAGTLGCLVFRENEWFILSNNHVVAASNQGKIGDEILQPGSADGGVVPDDVIATLEDFVPVEFTVELPDCQVIGGVVNVLNTVAHLVSSHHRLRAIRQNDKTNLVDAAIARPVLPEDVSREILGVGVPVGTTTPELGMVIQKSGRTTGVTHGKITQIDMTVSVMYPPSGIAVFEDQVAGDIHSEGGDSGSAVLSENNEVVGLLFAGGEGITIMNRFEHVMKALNVSV